MKKKIMLLGLFLSLSTIVFAQKFDSCITLQCNESFDPRGLRPPGIQKNMADSMVWDLPLPCIIKSLNKRLLILNNCIKGILYTDNTKDSTVQNSCNQFTTPRASSYCIKTDSSDQGSIWTKVFGIKELVLNSFVVRYNLPLKNSQAVPTNDPNNPKKLVVKIWKSGISLKRVEQKIISTHSRDTNFLVTFNLGDIIIPAGDSVLIQVFGAEPEYNTGRDPRDMSLWDFNGFKLNYDCITTCSWQGPVNQYPSKEACQEVDYWSWWSPDCARDYTIKVVRPIDKVTPNIVCKQKIVVSLNGHCSRVFAKTFDSGSFDNCGQVSFSARRMDQQNFDDFVEFCCADVGKTVMVVLRVTDPCGNYNDCMIEVQVQDKLPPMVVCPRDTLIECSQLDTSSWNKLGVSKVTDNCSTTTLKEDHKIDLTMCGLGTVTRTWTATDCSGNTAMCSQVINIVNSKPFGESNIIWPRDTVVDCTSSELIDPDKLGKPRFVGLTNCMMPLYNFQDQVFGTNKGGSCSKIIRTWKVIDWCQGISKSWIYLQIIEIVDRVKPIITCPSDVMFESYTGCKVPIIINLPNVTATDNCSRTGELIIHNNSTFADKAMENASGKYPPGVHTVTYMVTDECGHTATCSQKIVVVDKKPPVVFCQGIRTNLQAMPGMGIVQVIWAKDLVHKIESECCLINDIKVSFDSLGQVNQKWFDCSNVGLNWICIWITDCHGNQTKCCTWIDIQDNNGLCPPTKPDSVTLTVCTQHWLCAKPIEGVEFGGWGQTDHTGCLWVKLPKGSKIDLKPSYNDGDPLDGLSTADIVKIQKYILGKDSLNFYEKIAADVNKSGSITSADISEIRKLVLGSIIPGFKHNDWVFSPDSLSLNLDRDTTIHFIGVKLGDVNGNWCSHNTASAPEKKLSKKDVSLIDRIYEEILLHEQSALLSYDERSYENNDDFMIIPNPNTGDFIVTSSKEEKFKLFSLQGECLLRGRTNQSIKTNQVVNFYLKSGLYLIQVGRQVKKMIVQ